MKKLISIILAVLISVSAFAVMPLTAGAYYERNVMRENENFKYVYNIEDKDIQIYEYIGKNPEVNIPDKIDGSPVTAITRLAFEGCDFVTKITIPDTVKNVGDEAFCDTALYKDEKNWDNGVLYIGNVLVEAGDSLEGEYTVKKGTSVIALYAFAGCENLTKITIPGTVKYISESMFLGCKSLESAVLEEGVEDIDENAFKKCSKLENIKLPKSIKRVGMDAFKGTEFYNNIYNWENGALYCNNILIEVDPECDGIFTVKDGTTVLGDYAFMECNAEKIILPNGIKTLPYALVQNCLWLKTIQFGDDLEEIGSYSVADVQNVVLPDSVKKIDYRAFFQSRISEITLPENLKVIDVEAFLSCSHLKEITIPRNVEKIGHEALGYSMSGIGAEGYLTEKDEGLVIKGYPGTVAEAYAKEHGFEFVDITERPITGCTVEGVKNTTYSGKNITFDFTVKDGDKVLAPETDYEALYENNADAGEAALVITGKGIYTGQIRKTFKIAKADNPITVKTAKKTVKLAKLKKKAQTVKALKVSKAKGKVTYKLTGVPKSLGKLVKINSKGVVTISKWAKAQKGTYKIKVKITAKGNKNYKLKSIARTVTIKVK